MVHKGGILGPSNQGAEMLESEAIRGLFTLRRLGWGIKRIARELGIARNTVRDWLRDGVGRQYSGPIRSPPCWGSISPGFENASSPGSEMAMSSARNSRPGGWWPVFVL